MVNSYPDFMQKKDKASYSSKKNPGANLSIDRCTKLQELRLLPYTRGLSV